MNSRWNTPAAPAAAAEAYRWINLAIPQFLRFESPTRNSLGHLCDSPPLRTTGRFGTARRTVNSRGRCVGEQPKCSSTDHRFRVADSTMATALAGGPLCCFFLSSNIR